MAFSGQIALRQLLSPASRPGQRLSVTFRVCWLTRRAAAALRPHRSNPPRRRESLPARAGSRTGRIPRRAPSQTKGRSKRHSGSSPGSPTLHGRGLSRGRSARRIQAPVGSRPAGRGQLGRGEGPHGKHAPLTGRFRPGIGPGPSAEPNARQARPGRRSSIPKQRLEANVTASAPPVGDFHVLCCPPRHRTWHRIWHQLFHNLL